MGASTWTYFTPLHPRPAVALRRLRQEVFASGRYRRPPTGQERVALARQLPSPADGHRQAAASMRAAAEALRRNPTAEDTPESRIQLAAFFREARLAPPGGTVAEKLIAFYEQQAGRYDRMAQAAEAAQPRIGRFLGAMESGSAEGLPPAERRDFLLSQRLSAASPGAGRQPAGPPGSIEELLDRAGESGTHTILDITRVSRRAGHAVAFPLHPEHLGREFGTAEPTRAQVGGRGDGVRRGVELVRRLLRGLPGRAALGVGVRG